MGELIIRNINGSGAPKLNSGGNLSVSKKIFSRSNKQQLLTDASLILSYRPVDINISRGMEYQKVADRIYKEGQMHEEIIKNKRKIGKKEYGEYSRAIEELRVDKDNMAAAIKNALETDREQIKLFVKELVYGSKRILLVVRAIEKNAPTTERAKILFGLNFKYKLGLEDELSAELSAVSQTIPKTLGAKPSESVSSKDGRIFNPFSRRNDTAAIGAIEEVIRRCDYAEKRARANETAMRINDEKKEAEKRYYKLLEKKKARIRQQAARV